MKPAGPAKAGAPIFAALAADDLLAAGVPPDWIEPLRAMGEAAFLDAAGDLPAEAAEALLQYATTGVLTPPEPPEPAIAPADAYAHPDARRRFLTVESAEELAAALAAPWEKWSVFLHPSQRAIVERVFAGPARIAGSAGTGKTVVAVHRAVRAIRRDPAARVLITTFSDPLAADLAAKAGVLAGPDPSIVPRITAASFQALAIELFQLAFGRRPRIASAEQTNAALARAAEASGLAGFSPRFLAAEWAQVIDAWRVADAEGYASVPRLGRRNRLGARQRAALWPVFAAARARLEAQGLATWPGVFHQLADYYAAHPEKPFGHIIVDEAQDLGAAELRLLAALAPAGEDALFFAGDLGQRIFQQPFSWKALGVDVRGRSAILKVNYRTSRQIREAADRLLGPVVRDADGAEEDRRGTISVFEGPAPQAALAADEAAEAKAVAAFIGEARAGGIGAHEIAVFVRSRAQLARARAAVRLAGERDVELEARIAGETSGVAVGVMHLAKGLEFRAVAVMACDEAVLPLSERIAAAVEETDLDDVYETERQLLYVACTRARDRLMVSGVAPGSEFAADMRLASS